MLCNYITTQLLCLILLLSPLSKVLLHRTDTRKYPIHSSPSSTLILGKQPERKCHVFSVPLIVINVLLRFRIRCQFRNAKSQGSIFMHRMLYRSQNKWMMATCNMMAVCLPGNYYWETEGRHKSLPVGGKVKTVSLCVGTQASDYTWREASGLGVSMRGVLWCCNVLFLFFLFFNYCWQTVLY